MEYISEIIDKLGTDNIEYYGLLEPSDKYAQGIDVSVSPRQEPWEGPAVYFLTDHIREVSYMRVYYIPLEEHAINKFGYELKTSYSSALEYHLLKEYKKTYDRLPELNTMIK